MENNDIYYKKYMKYKLKYLNLLNNYQSDNIDTSESFNASKIMGGATIVLNAAGKLAKKAAKKAAAKRKSLNSPKERKSSEPSPTKMERFVSSKLKNVVKKTMQPNQILNNIINLSPNLIIETLSKLKIDDSIIETLKEPLKKLISSNDELKNYICNDENSDV